MIGFFTMLVSLRDLLMRIPIVRMLRDSKEERERTVDLQRELRERQTENERRVQVLSWLTYPRTNQNHNHDNH